MIARSMDCKETVRRICGMCKILLKKIVQCVQRLDSKGDTAIFERILGKFFLLLFLEEVGYNYTRCCVGKKIPALYLCNGEPKG